MSVRFAAALAASCLTLPATSQEWDWRVTPYLWATGVDGTVALGPLGRDVDVSFSDIVDVLSGTALLHVEAERDGHVLFGDLVWLAVEPDDKLATIGGLAETEADSTIIELGYARPGVDVFGFEVGLRYWDLDLEINPTFAPALVRGDSWTDAFGGFRRSSELGQRWTLTTRGNLGTGGADLTIGFQMDFARVLSGGNSLVAGIKLLDIEYEKAAVRGIPLTVDATFFGATFGFMFD